MRCLAQCQALLLNCRIASPQPAALACCLRAFLAFFFWARSAASCFKASLCCLLTTSASAAVVRASCTDQWYKVTMHDAKG